MAVALAALGLAAAYTIYLNPEVRLYRHASEVKEKWIAQLDQTALPKYVVFGGSSCATSLMGERLLDNHGLRVANLGLQAGMGADVLSRYALKHTRKGDVLIMSMEPSLLTTSSGIPSLGKQFALVTGNADLLEERTISDRLSNLLAMRPGGYHFFTLLGKILLRQPLYRYSPEDFDASGYQRVTVRRDFAVPPLAPLTLSSSSRELLTFLRSTCERRGIKLLYALPWFYTPPDQVDAYRLNNLSFLVQVADFMPVLQDDKLGAWPVRSAYADTDAHLTPEGATRHTDAFAAALEKGTTWSAKDLMRLRDSLP